MALGEYGEGDGEDGGAGVGGNGEELGLGGSEAEFFDDGRLRGRISAVLRRVDRSSLWRGLGGTHEEEGEGVKREAHGVEAQAVQPAFRVFEGFGDVGPGESFVVGGVTVRFQAGMDIGALVVR